MVMLFYLIVSGITALSKSGVGKTRESIKRNQLKSALLTRGEMHVAESKTPRQSKSAGP